MHVFRLSSVEQDDENLASQIVYKEMKENCGSWLLEALFLVLIFKNYY